MADVFISYKRSEGTSALVRRIADELESMGISCWYDTKDPDPGYFTQTIEREILRCKVFLLIWDEGANNSEWCLTETYTAFDGENHAVRIPFQIGQFTKHPEMSFYMRRCQIFSHDSPENADIQKLIVKIAALFGKKTAKTEKVSQKIPQSSTASENQSVKIIQSGFCGKYGNNLTYTLDENGILTISGNGDMDNYGHAPAGSSHWGGKDLMISTVLIQKGVTSIGSCSFGAADSLYSSCCKSLVSVKIPNSVTFIGNYAFGGCDSLANVEIPDSVTNIGYGAFPNTTKVIRRK